MINQAGGNDQPVSLQGLGSAAVEPADAHNPAVPDAQVGQVAWRPRAIHHHTAADEEIERHVKSLVSTAIASSIASPEGSKALNPLAGKVMLPAVPCLEAQRSLRFGAVQT